MTGAPQPKPGAQRRAPAAVRLSGARLAAVQALYQTEIAGGEIDELVAEFLIHRSSRAAGEDGDFETDPRLFEELVRGTYGRREELDGLLIEFLSDGWPLARLEIILRCILRVGAFELVGRPAVPARVIISEHVDLAHAFYEGPERGMVNGVLDKLARRVRPGELGDENGERTAPAR